MTVAENDKYASEILGFSLTQGLTAYKESLSGDDSSMDSLLEEAANANDITPEHAAKLAAHLFGL